MTAANPTYRKLPGGGLSWAASYRLYEAPDHLLQVCSTGYNESYKRFFFRDIQSVVVQENQMRRLWSAIFAGSLFVCLAGWVAELVSSAEISLAWVMFGGFFTLLFVVLLALNWWLGPTCSCYVRTAVQLEKLPSLRRLRKARGTVKKIKSLVATAQGAFSPETMATAVIPNPVPEAPPVVVLPPVASAQDLPAPAPPRHCDGQVHLYLCGLLVADLPITALYCFDVPGAQALATVLMVATVAVAIVAGIKQLRSDLPARIKRVPWLALGVQGAVILGGIIWGIVAVIQQGPERFGSLSVWENPFMLTMTIISTSLDTLMGGLGLLWLRGWRAGERRDPPLFRTEPPTRAE